MISRIEAKMKSYVESILAKETIDYNEYNVISSYLAKLKADESAEKYEENKKEYKEAFASLLSLTTL